MTKKAQPKVSDLVEILLQQMIQFEKVMTKNNKILIDSISKLENKKVEFNIEELEKMEKSYRQNLKKDFEIFHANTRKNNNILLNVHKRVTSKRLLYIIIINLFLLSASAISIYIAVKKSIEKSQYEALLEENKQLKYSIETVEEFFYENNKATKMYEKWLKK